MRLRKHYEMMKGELLSAVLAHEFSIDDDIWIIRERKPIVDNYRYIIDWYAIDDFKNGLAAEPGDKFRAVRLPFRKVIAELDEWIEIT